MLNDLRLYVSLVPKLIMMQSQQAMHVLFQRYSAEAHLQLFQV